MAAVNDARGQYALLLNRLVCASGTSGNCALHYYSDRVNVFVDSRHRLVREGLESLLESRYRITSVFEADVAIQDLRGVRPPYPRPFRVSTLALIHDDDGSDPVEVLRAGYRGYFRASEGRQQLDIALQSLVRGENWAERHVLAAAVYSPSAPSLTRREAETYKLVMQGFSNREIADELDISVNTVKTHVSRVLDEFQVRSRVELIHKALPASTM